MKKFNLLFLLFISVNLTAQNNIISAEYWFDMNFDSRTEIGIAPSQQVLYASEIPVTDLYDGLHSVHFRFQDENYIWSSVVSAFFIKSTLQGEAEINEIEAYEYWFDNDLNNKVTVSLTNAKSVSLQEDITVSDLSKGLHSVHFRFLDARGNWSSAVSRFFIITTNESIPGGNEIVEVEYWFDRDINNRTALPAGASKDYQYLNDLDVSFLNTGLHTINFRFKDSRGDYSSALSKFFIKIREMENPGDNEIISFRYWFNDSVMNYKDIPDPSADLVFIDSLDMRHMMSGEYFMNIQFKDKRGLWSSPVHDTIQKLIYPYADLFADKFEVCENDSVLFSANIIDADSIRWDFSDGTFVSALETRHSFDGEGEYSVSAEVFHTDENTSNIVDIDPFVRVHANPSFDLLDTLELLNDESYTLTVEEGFENYLWNDEPGGYQYPLSGMELGQGEHFIRLAVENEFGCINSDTIVVIVKVIDNTGSFSSETIRVYPNPAADYVFIQSDNVPGEVSVKVFDLTGKVFLIENLSSSLERLNVSHLLPGNYYMQIRVGKELTSIPFIKE